MFPINSTSIGILFSAKYKHSENFHDALNARKELEQTRDFTKAMDYYKKLREFYILYSSAPLKMRMKYATTDIGHGFRWAFSSGREVEMHDIGFEYLCCMESIVVYILQRLTSAESISEINTLVAMAIPVVGDLEALATHICPSRNMYLPLELKLPSVMALVALFLSYSSISTFYNTVNSIEMNDVLSEDEITTISNVNFDTLLGLYQATFLAKTASYKGWKEIEKSDVGVYVDTINNIENHTNRMKQIITFFSLFNSKIFSYTRRTEVQSVIKGVGKLLASNSDILRELMYKIYDMLVEIIDERWDTDKTKLAIEASSEKAGVSKNISEYIEKNNIEPVVVL